MEAERYAAHLNAREILQRAEDERRRILEAAHTERQAVLAEARAAGREQGMAQVSELLLRARLAAGQELERSREALTDILLRLTERCVGRAVETVPDLAVEWVARAIDRLRRSQAVSVRLHPDTLAEVSVRRAQLLDLLGRSVDVTLRGDPELERHGCIVESDQGSVDGRLTTQLEVLERVLRDALGGDPA